MKDNIKHIYLVRHAESDANLNNTFSPPDTPLSKKGREQAHMILSQCQQLPVESIITSDYSRTIATSDIINESLNKSVIRSKLFREIKRPSEIVGMKKDNSKALAITNEITLHEGESSWHYSDEENFHESLIRMQEALIFLADQKENHILVVTHSGTLKVLFGALLCENILSPSLMRSIHDHLVTINTGVTYLRYQQKEDFWKLVTWNNFSHLSEVA